MQHIIIIIIIMIIMIIIIIIIIIIMIIHDTWCLANGRRQFILYTYN